MQEPVHVSENAIVASCGESAVSLQQLEDICDSFDRVESVFRQQGAQLPSEVIRTSVFPDLLTVLCYINTPQPAASPATHSTADCARMAQLLATRVAPMVQHMAKLLHDVPLDAAREKHPLVSVMVLFQGLMLHLCATLETVDETSLVLDVFRVTIIELLRVSPALVSTVGLLAMKTFQRAHQCTYPNAFLAKDILDAVVREYRNAAARRDLQAVDCLDEILARYVELYPSCSIGHENGMTD